ncbi:hypothetical protein BDN72DRAFT_57538 [Pluteus cervinus]|uniref:Uncharacterized protein n=1 Tax=Pluteus cervinus TaxID=181527 RepID=A0ACD3B913_9AGAR|nr:hypothetical protein BDN72DRAFT_57538 [Pluteus cervinus]
MLALLSPQVTLNEFHNQQAASPGDVVGIPDGDFVVAPIVPITIVRVNAPEHNTVPREPSSPSAEDQEPENEREPSEAPSVVSDSTVVDEVEANGKPSEAIEQVINLGENSATAVPSPPEIVVVTPPVEVSEDSVPETSKDEPTAITTTTTEYEPVEPVVDNVEVTKVAETTETPATVDQPPAVDPVDVTSEPEVQSQPIESVSAKDDLKEEGEEASTPFPAPEGAAVESVVDAATSPVPAAEAVESTPVVEVVEAAPVPTVEATEPTPVVEAAEAAQPVTVEEPITDAKEEAAKVEENGNANGVPVVDAPAATAEPVPVVDATPAAETKEASPPAETPAAPVPPVETPAAPTAKTTTPNGTINKSATVKSSKSKRFTFGKSHKSNPSTPLTGLPNGHGGVANGDGNGTLKGHGHSKSEVSEFGRTTKDSDSDAHDEKGVNGNGNGASLRKKKTIWKKLKEVFKHEKEVVQEALESK